MVSAYQTLQFAEEVGEEFDILVVDDEVPSGPFTILDVDPDPDDDESNHSKM